MRFSFGSIAFLLLAMLVIGCTWVDADECWVNTSGGFGGGGMIPIGAGVGATTSGGDFISPPPGGPLDYGGKPNPCVAPQNSAAEEMQNRVGQFAAAAFTFKVTLADDGKDKAGGWQEASTQLEFSDARDRVLKVWTCSVVVGMPIRSEKGGTVSSDYAAKATAGAANLASDVVITRREEWLPSDFCAQFGVALATYLNAKPKIFGAIVKRSTNP
jgi:hypothetical protein